MEENTEVVAAPPDDEPVSEIIEDTEIIENSEIVEEVTDQTESSEVVEESETGSSSGVSAGDGSGGGSGSSIDYTEVLNEISDTLTDIVESNEPFISTFAIGSSGEMDGYWFSYASDKIYIPFDKVPYFSETEDGQLINLSSGTVTCYAVASDGTTGSTYRFPSFGTAEQYIPSSSYGGTWNDIKVYASNSNLILGQTGINNMTDLLLFFVLLLLGILVFVRRK